jgi:hypothetical protein
VYATSARGSSDFRAVSVANRRSTVDAPGRGVAVREVALGVARRFESPARGRCAPHTGSVVCSNDAVAFGVGKDCALYVGATESEGLVHLRSQFVVIASEEHGEVRLCGALLDD